MKLFHFSDFKIYQQLEPRIGNNRGPHEDPRAVGVPVVWLTNQPNRAPGAENCKFRYTVEIPDYDLNLHRDKKDKDMKLNWLKFKKESVSEKIEKIYFYTKSITITETFEMENPQLPPTPHHTTPQ